VKLAPQKADNPQAEESGHGRMSLDKRFQGDLEATGQGEMLSFMMGAKGSGAYVAIEKVTGTLGGRKGSFLLQHSGTMSRGVNTHHSVTVIPDSGTLDLGGLSGSMKIIVAPDGKHAYEMEYSLAAFD
jgi:hypothetical protein